jgi:hypothetical protein
MSDTDAIMAEWRQIEARVRLVADECRADPIKAEMTHGVRLEVPLANDPWQSFGGERARSRVNDRAQWLRATAKKLIPPRFAWDVMETIGGGAVLVLKSVDDRVDDAQAFGLPPS